MKVSLFVIQRQTAVHVLYVAHVQTVFANFVEGRHAICVKGEKTNPDNWFSGQVFDKG